MVFISFLLNTFFADVLGYEVKPAVGASTEDDDLPGMRRREVVQRPLYLQAYTPEN